MRVAYQGVSGAFSEVATHILFPASEPVPRQSMEAVFDSVTEGRVDYGVIPIENSLFGSIHINYDFLLTHSVKIIGELQLRIRHHLMAIQQVSLSGITKVLSHPQAIGQCQDFLKGHLNNAAIEAAYDTAGAAQIVAQEGKPHVAAIASTRAAQKYRLEIIAQGIESHSKNYTRFLVLAAAESESKPAPSSRPYKTSIAFALRSNIPGSLFKSLAIFALRDLDLLKIESRPRKGTIGSYLFFLDILGSLNDLPLQRALEHLKELTDELHILGSYPSGYIADDGDL